MVQAINEARQTLPVFWQALDARLPGDKEFDVKIGLARPDKELEYVWVNVLRREAGQCIGVLDGEPFDLSNLKAGDGVSFADEMIQDWTFTRGGVAYGHFSTRVLVGLAEPNTSRKVQRMLSPRPLPADAT